ncbi:MAG: hypothetical protein OEV87_04850 [Phycisphaerae bacterium]|nr:hypothetical protein [Phycisphaerae bacterium]
MDSHRNNPVEVLRQGLVGSCEMNDDVVSAAVLLAGRLEALKRTSPMFKAISFSPEAEAIVEAELAVAAN